MPTVLCGHLILAAWSSFSGLCLKLKDSYAQLGTGSNGSGVLVRLILLICA